MNLRKPISERPKPPRFPTSTTIRLNGFSTVQSIQFGTFSQHEMMVEAEALIRERQLLVNSDPVEGGVLDERMGVTRKNGICKTCNQNVKNCTGHFGIIEFAQPVWHIGYFRHVLHILQCICKSCSRNLLPVELRNSILAQTLRPDIDSSQRELLYRKVLLACKKVSQCLHCGMMNGNVRRAPNANAPRILHDLFQTQEFQQSEVRMHARFMEVDDALRANNQLRSALEEASVSISPRRAYTLLCRIPDEELPLVWCNPVHSRPENLIYLSMLVPPIALRPSVSADFSTGSTEDDLTIKLQEIVIANENLARQLINGSPLKVVQETHDHLTNAVSQFINGDLTSSISASAATSMTKPPRRGGGGGLGRNINAGEDDINEIGERHGPPRLIPMNNNNQPQDNRPPQKTGTGRKPIRGLIQRIKGKQGRFRGNLSGKRVDFSGRTVISPDPNLGVHEVGLPIRMAMRLTFPEVVHKYNIEEMKSAVRNGPKKHPGAAVIRLANRSLDLKIGDLNMLAQNLQFGDVVERHLRNGDIVLFNRQPSLHRQSIMAHEVRVLEGHTLRFNECCCAPYNADFDGDEMNIHVPQTEVARAEARLLMSVASNLVTAQNGEPLVAATQDFITGSFLLTSQDQFFTKEQFVQIVAQASDCTEFVRLPYPAIVKPVQYWTGKQVWSMIVKGACKEHWINIVIRERLRFTEPSNKDAPSDDVLCVQEGLVEFRNNELMCGSLGKNSLGGSKTSVFYAILRDVSELAAVSAMNRMTKLVPRWFANLGFSFGIEDVIPSSHLVEKKSKAIAEGFAQCDLAISQANSGDLKLKPGCDMIESLESTVSGILSRVRDQLGQACMESLPWGNAPRTMALCGSKGSALNICQMVMCVGQQIVGGARIPNGFDDRALPHFPKEQAREPRAKGFVENSFYSGLDAPEFFFHTMAGREGLVDTAVKTAETGYMARRLVKALEDLSVSYDGTVLDSSKSVVQFIYGDDGLNPMLMESSGPLEFSRLERQVKAMTTKELSVKEKELMAQFQGVLGGRDCDFLQLEDLNKTLEFVKSYMYNALPCFYGGCKTDTSVRLIRPLENEQKESIDRYFLNELQHYDPGKDKFLEFFLSNLKKSMKELNLIQLARIILFSVEKVRRAITEPGEAVGAIGAQSLGEPGTQMTLKTFHFAGVASMNVTLGVPRLKEIINASKNISTPIITARLVNPFSLNMATAIKAQVEFTQLGEICTQMHIVYGDGCPKIICYLLHEEDLKALGLGFVTPLFVKKKIMEDGTRLKITDAKIVQCANEDVPAVIITVDATAGKTRKQASEVHVERNGKDLLNVNPRAVKLLHDLKQVPIAGNPNVTRCVINRIDPQDIRGYVVKDVELSKASDPAEDTPRNCYYMKVCRQCFGEPNAEEPFEVLVEGRGLLDVMGLWGVDPAFTRTNDIMEIEKVLGLEAARQVIIDEVKYIFERYGLVINHRHLSLLADVMTYRGVVLGITRFGIAKMKDSVLSLASFERTSEHLLDGAAHGRRDDICGVSECIVVGSHIPMGTGAVLLFDEEETGKGI